MRIGVFADTHDHVDNMRHAVAEFNRAGCELVIFAGDFVSPLVVPPLRKLGCPMIAAWGDSDGNKIGIAGGMRIIGDVGEPPFGIELADGRRILVTHIPDMLRGQLAGVDIVISSHTHRPSISNDEQGRLYVNPGEAGGWMFRKPTIAIIETTTLEARLVSLPEMPPPPEIPAPAAT